MTDLDALIEKIRQKMTQAAGLKARVKFDFGAEGGCLLVDTTQDPPQITREDGEADTVFICSPDTFASILDGTRDPNIAFMTGKLKIQGSMGLAMKLNAILEG